MFSTQRRRLGLTFSKTTSFLPGMPRRLFANSFEHEKPITRVFSPTRRYVFVASAAFGSGILASYLFCQQSLSTTTQAVKKPVDIQPVDVDSLQDTKAACHVPLLSTEQSNHRLRANEAEYIIKHLGDCHYHRNTLPSNSVTEDAHEEAVVKLSSGHVLGLWGIYDGHMGSAMSTALSKTLTSAVALELDKVFSPGADFSSDAVMHAIKNSFLKVDDYFVWQRHEELLQHPPPDSSITRDPLSLPATNLLQEALAGSCALLSIYDYQSRLFYVAVAGDSRAVLGRRSGKNTWTATALSRDQFSFNPDEKARIQSQHPGELDVLRKGRLLGLLEPTRAFGDMYFKWTDEMQNMIRTRYLNDHNQARQTVPNTTPPYLTAEPVVTTTSIRPEKDDFIVMASDGLWELLSNEEVVGLVGQWIDGQKDKCDVGGKGIVITASTSDSTDQKGPDSNRLGVFSPSERFTCEDSNAATHLLRNALGGKLHQGQTFRAMLTLSSPLSRAYRDDLTVMVLFFGEMPGDGGSITNSSA